MCDPDGMSNMSLDLVRVALDTKLCDLRFLLLTDYCPKPPQSPQKSQASIPSKYSSASHKKPQLQSTISHLLP